MKGELTRGMRGVGVSRRILYGAGLFYLAGPIFVFFLTWLRLPVGVLASVVLGYGLLAVWQRLREVLPGEVALHWGHGATAGIVLLFLLSTGNCGFFGTTGVDISCRDAIYADLIRYPWPVVYEETQAILAYYLAFWLVPAGLSFLLGLGWTGSHVILFFWMYAGLLLILWLLGDVLEAGPRQLLVVCGVFLLWSGLNFLGMLPKSIFAKTALTINDYPGFDSWAFAGGMSQGYQMNYFIRTTFDAVANVYNQFIPLGIGAMLFLRLPHWVSGYAMIGLLTLPYSPCGFIGFFLVLAGSALWALWQKRQRGEAGGGRTLFSAENLSAAVAIFPILYGYYGMNPMAGLSQSGSIFYAPLAAYGLFRVGMLLLYYVLFFGIYMVLIAPTERRCPLYWLVGGVLLVGPFFRVGTGGDFAWNSSIIPFLIVMVMVLRTLFAAGARQCFWGRSLWLAILLGIAATTPLMQMTTSFRGCALEGKIAVYRDDVGFSGTLAGRNPLENGNFLGTGYQESFFYQYLARQS